MAASVTSEPPHWNLTADRSPGASSASMLASCTATGLVPCIGGEKCSVSSWRVNRLDDAAVVVADRDDVDARQRVEVALAVHVPVIDAVGPGHDQRRLRPLGHLVADEDVAEKLLLGGLGLGDQIGQGGGHEMSSEGAGMAGVLSWYGFLSSRLMRFLYS